MQELEITGLELNTKKTKILTNQHNLCPSESSKIMFVNSKCFHILKAHEYHRYLGKFVSCARGRAEIEIKHRISAAWYGFHKHSHTLCNSNISLKKRLRLFSSCVSPCALYATSTLALTNQDLETFDICHRKMLRKILGYNRHDGETWETTMRRLKNRMNHVWQQFRMKSWSELILERKYKWVTRISKMHSSRWARIISMTNYFEMHGKRKSGRLRMRWKDQLNYFAISYGFSSWLNFAIKNLHLWTSQCHHFVDFVLSDWWQVIWFWK